MVTFWGTRNLIGSELHRELGLFGSEDFYGRTTIPGKGPPGEGPRGGFRALIRAGRKHRADGRKGRVKGRLQGGDTEIGARSKKCVTRYIIRGFSERLIKKKSG